MAVTSSKNLKCSEGDINLFDVEWNTLNIWFTHIDGNDNGNNRTKFQIPSGVTRDDIFYELEKRRGMVTKNDTSTTTVAVRRDNSDIDLVSSWITYMDDDDFDLVFSTSSLTEGSDFTISGLGKSRTKDEEEGDDDIVVVKREDCSDEFHEDKKQRRRETSDCDFIRDPAIKSLPEANEWISKGSISYAQLFFDPETQMLVTLMEMNLGLGYARKEREEYRNKKLFRQSLSITTNNNVMKKDFKLETTNEVLDVRPQDQTLLTECSSISSETHYSFDYGFDTTDFDHFPIATKTRFLDEPIVFSDDDNNNRICWFEGRDFDTYLLHDCDDPWDFHSTKGTKFADTLRKMLTASRCCISLPQIGESKWKASKGDNGLSKGNCKAHSERLSYSVLEDL
mmetsp:Transcript_4164/g.4655  ORF Transcript_4164/g.4655 Transcript_4164/m.4655 type:complete len:396 (-) Transcript_4164:2167-3354(-)